MNDFGKTNFSLSIFKDIVPLVIMSLIVFYSCFIGNAMINMGGTALICLYLLFCRNAILLPAMLYFSSFAFIFQAGDFMLYEFLCIIFICRVFIVAKRMIGMLVAWVIIYFITHLISSSITLGNIIPVIYVMTLLFACVTYEGRQYNNCVIMFLLGIIITSALGFLKPFSPYLLDLLSEDFAEGMSIDYIVRFSGLSYDPNFYTIGVVISIMLLLFNKYQKNWINLALCVVYICLGAVTFSKSYILSLAFISLLYLIDGKTGLTTKILLFALLGGVVSASYFDEIVYVFKERFSGTSDFNELTTGRGDLWRLYWGHIGDTFETLFFGHGFSGLQGHKAAHNTYLEILFNFGIVGFIIDVLYVKKCFKFINKRRWFSIVNLGLLSITLILFFNLSAYTFPSLWGIIFMTFILISKRSENNYVEFKS